MGAGENVETLSFETEVNQLLDIMIHSLYSNKEIFMRELISNASDACDKFRFASISDASLIEDETALSIRIEFNKDAKTITFIDNGIGMNRDDVINHIGTIAKSGTKEFLGSLTGDQANDSKMIGQFGVGFYSSFIVADEISLTTRKAGEDASTGIKWTSKGKGDYTLESLEKASRGTEIVLHLKDNEDEFLNDWKLKSLIRQYSDHISFPIIMQKVTEPEEEGGETSVEDETVNQASALWTKPKSEIKKEEYIEFYKHISHDYEEPMTWSHNRVEGANEYTSLLYIPARAPFDLYEREASNGIKLFVQRVFIMEDSEQLIPKYLRFVKGLVDSNNLPLNVSREILQSSKVIDSIKTGSVKKILQMLEKMAKNDPEQYQKFWDEFGKVIKEGPAEDHANREKIAKLLRFATSHLDQEKQTVSLDDYVSRMQEGQDKIYYIAADSFSAAKNSPHLEVLRKKGFEVILLSDRVDEWLTSHLKEYDGKSIVSIAKGELNLGATEEDKKELKEKAESSKEMLERMKKALDSKVDDVRVSSRLTDSPACIVINEHDMAMHMQRLMKEAGHAMPSGKPVLEINPDHPIVKRMDEEKSDDQFNDWSGFLFDQAILAEGGQLEDPASFVNQMNKMLVTINA